jgi:short-subunit dehydrogenase involved in D-alanine esterification of teichoic acids
MVLGPFSLYQQKDSHTDDTYPLPIYLPVYTRTPQSMHVYMRTLREAQRGAGERGGGSVEQTVQETLDEAWAEAEAEGGVSAMMMMMMMMMMMIMIS